MLIFNFTNTRLYWPDLILMNSDQSQAEEAEWVGLTITEALHKAWRNRRNLPQNRPKPLKEVYEERLVLKLHCKWQFTSGGCTIFFIYDTQSCPTFIFIYYGTLRKVKNNALARQCPFNMDYIKFVDFTLEIPYFTQVTNSAILPFCVKLQENKFEGWNFYM